MYVYKFIWDYLGYKLVWFGVNMKLCILWLIIGNK